MTNQTSKVWCLKSHTTPFYFKNLHPHRLGFVTDLFLERLLKYLYFSENLTSCSHSCADIAQCQSCPSSQCPHTDVYCRKIGNMSDQVCFQKPAIHGSKFGWFSRDCPNLDPCMDKLIVPMLIHRPT